MFNRSLDPQYSIIDDAHDERHLSSSSDIDSIGSSILPERPLRIIDHTLESAVNVFNQNEFVIMTKLRQERDSVIKLLHFQDTMTRKL